MNPFDLNDAIKFLKDKQAEVADGSEFGWRIVYRAQMHLESQLDEYFSEAA